MDRSKRFMIIGGVLLVIGWLITFAGTVYLIPQIVWLGFVAYGLTLFGFGLGMYGVIMHIQSERKK